MSITTYALNRHTTPVGTNSDTYLMGSAGAWANTKGAREVIVTTRRYSDVGTCTLDTFVEYLYEPDGTWLPLVDYAGTAVSGVQYADGGTDAAGTAHELLILTHLPAGTVTAGVITYGTTKKAYQIWIPERIRVRFRHGGTSVQNEFSALLQIHTVA